VKPQIVSEALDGRDASPHLPDMAEGKNDKAGGAQSREAKLAQALRANLRRRKAGGAPAPAQKPHKPKTD